MAGFIDLTGDRYGRLTIIKRAKYNLQGKPAWVCECDCGNIKVINGSSLRQGLTRSCGCLHREAIGERASRQDHWGESNPNWRGGTSRNGYDAGFTEEFKEVIRKRDLYCCQICGMPQEENGEKLSIHHIDYDRSNTIPENCVALCRSCHSRTNGNRKYWYNKLRRL